MKGAIFVQTPEIYIFFFKRKQIEFFFGLDGQSDSRIRPKQALLGLQILSQYYNVQKKKTQQNMVPFFNTFGGEVNQSNILAVSLSFQFQRSLFCFFLLSYTCENAWLQQYIIISLLCYLLCFVVKNIINISLQISLGSCRLGKGYVLFSQLQDVKLVKFIMSPFFWQYYVFWLISFWFVGLWWWVMYL
eukprot:TRINITY_DN47030_c0_g1_i2.p5 TRINITY_DN47030_c0_g1~~TRINITY_DN47030_c0_g1_i2.p5  ORF type:complete len:189 (-),score=7.36 TRINITY_DN47030_c0_g1_i2:971-1537(-)